MSHNRPHILLTNDDGIHAPGLYRLWSGLKDHCDVTIVAPMTEQSGAGLSITTQRPLHIQQVPWEGKTAAYQVDGTPADCIKLALAVICPKFPDMIASGINRGANSGRNILYSGTVAGVIEGTMRNVPGIAFSCDDFDTPNYERAEQFVYPMVRYLLDHPLSPGTFLNVTFPDHEGPIRGIKLARQGRSYWVDDPEERLHPTGHRYYWLGGQRHRDTEHLESDVELVANGWLTAVPIRVQELTDHIQFQDRKESFERWFIEHLPMKNHSLNA
ncbi:MAG: 5'/3'-nucleotidase SurE [Simkania sp.]|nr:5'/3'-nucleotidase SurE [Simkania sp.]